MKSRLTKEERIYLVHCASWVREQRARIADIESAIHCSTIILNENKTQLACLRRVLRAALKPMNQWNRKHGQAVIRP